MGSTRKTGDFGGSPLLSRTAEPSHQASEPVRRNNNRSTKAKLCLGHSRTPILRSTCQVTVNSVTVSILEWLSTLLSLCTNMIYIPILHFSFPFSHWNSY